MKLTVLIFLLSAAALVFVSEASGQSSVDIFLKNKRKSGVEKKAPVTTSENAESPDADSEIENQPVGKSACQTTIAQSPALRGLKLGMKIEQVEALFPGAILRSEKLGETLRPRNGFREIYLDSIGSEAIRNAKIDLSGIVRGKLEFLDDVLTAVRLYYNRATADFYHREEEFRKLTATNLKLPHNAWNGNLMQCSGFTVRVGTESETLIWLETVGIKDIVKQRQEKELQRQRETFKP